MKRMRPCLLAAALAGMMVLLSGCGKIVFTSGIGQDQLFTVGDQTGSSKEVNVYLVTMENQYKAAYGDDVFTRSGNETVGDSLKENALERLVKVKALDQIAADQGVSIDETDQSKAHQAAASYMDSLSDADRNYLDVDQNLVSEMYAEYALAVKMADHLVADVPREVSDADARTVTVQSILIRTYSTDDNGNRVEFTDAQKAEAKQKAISIRNEIQEGMDNLRGITFDTWIAEYNEDSVSTYTFGKGQVDSAFETAAFNLPVGTISDVVETSDGYRIIKCISVSDEQEMEQNKEAILEQRLDDAYVKAYDSAAANLQVDLNKELWEKVTLCGEPDVTTDNFFEMYNQNFGSGSNS